MIWNDTPKNLSKGTSSHSIDFISEDIILPLQLKGIISYLPVCIPTQKEIDECIILETTSENVEREPYSEEFESNECTFEMPERIPLINRQIYYTILSQNIMILEMLSPLALTVPA